MKDDAGRLWTQCNTLDMHVSYSGKENGTVTVLQTFEMLSESFAREKKLSSDSSWKSRIQCLQVEYDSGF
jgi:hypothetical protein